jgi:hypothetical protein
VYFYEILAVEFAFCGYFYDRVFFVVFVGKRFGGAVSGDFTGGGIGSDGGE